MVTKQLNKHRRNYYLFIITFYYYLLLITFEDQMLPTYSFLYSIRYEVTPFVPRTSICFLCLRFLCLRFGHVKQQCRSQSRCHHCARKEHEKDSPSSKILNPLFCANCKSSHRTINPKCQAFVLQKKFRIFLPPAIFL